MPADSHSCEALWSCLKKQWTMLVFYSCSPLAAWYEAVFLCVFMTHTIKSGVTRNGGVLMESVVKLMFPWNREFRLLHTALCSLCSVLYSVFRIKFWAVKECATTISTLVIHLINPYLNKLLKNPVYPNYKSGVIVLSILWMMDVEKITMNMLSSLFSTNLTMLNNSSNIRHC